MGFIGHCAGGGDRTRDGSGNALPLPRLHFGLFAFPSGGLISARCGLDAHPHGRAAVVQRDGLELYSACCAMGQELL